MPSQIVFTSRHAQLLNNGGGGTKIVELVGGFKDCWDGGRDKDCWEGGRAQTVKQFKVQKGGWYKIEENKPYFDIFSHYLSVL